MPEPNNPRDGQEPRLDPQPSRRRSRLPEKATLVFDESLAANEHHPLANAAPEARALSRLKLIGSILARLARLSPGAIRRGA